MPVHKDHYVIVNIWTSKNNAAIQGSNCGHISLTTPDSYMSIWPKEPFASKPYATTFFGQNSQSRPAAFKTDYQEDCLLEGRSEQFMRPISSGSDLKEGEILYRIDTKTDAFEVWANDIPPYCEPHYRFAAVKLVQANFRMILYSLNIEKIESEFERLTTSVSGWSMAGSNMLTRTGCTEPAENCASLAFSCLRAGGLPRMVETRGSSTTPRAVTTDYLLRRIVALKENELDEFPETQEFTVFDADATPILTTSLETIQEGFEPVDRHSCLQSLIDTLVQTYNFFMIATGLRILLTMIQDALDSNQNHDSTNRPN